MMTAGMVAEPTVAPEPAIGPFLTARLAGPSTSASSISREDVTGATTAAPARK